MGPENLRSRCLNLSVIFTLMCLAAGLTCWGLVSGSNPSPALAATTSGPDLIGSWEPFSYYSRGSLLVSKLKATNIGNKKATQFRIAYYLSPDGTRQGTLIWRTIVPASLNAGQTRIFPLIYFMPKSAIGKYVLAVIDCDGRVAETNENNNRVAARIGNSHHPIANAGPDQTAKKGDTVSLDGRGSNDPDGDKLSYQWSFDSKPTGSRAVLSNPASVQPKFTIDLAGTYVVRLVVNDGVLNSSPDTVLITTLNSPPVAHAGPNQTVPLNGPVTLDGSKSSDVDGDLLAFSWSFTSKPSKCAAALDNPTSVAPVFQADKAGEYVLELAAFDPSGSTDTDEVLISTTNSVPVANADADQSVFVGNTVTLDGSASSDADGDPLTCSWSISSKPQGSGATLSDPTAVKPIFDVDLPGTYVVQLVVNDGKANSPADTVVVNTQNSPPVAHAGPAQTCTTGATVTLDGTGSTDVDGDTLAFKWSFVSKPAGSTASLSDPSAPKPTFTADVFGTYVLQLMVNDGSVNSAPGTVTVSTINSPPVARAGSNQTLAYVASVVPLDGSGSTDVDGNPLTYHWSFVSLPSGSGAALSDPTAVQPSFTADVFGTYVVQLIVNDGAVDSAPATVTATTENSKPVADAGTARTARVGDTVTLDGSMSSDVDKDPLTYKWSFTSIPKGSLAALSDSTAVNPSFPIDLPGLYVAQLMVNDGREDSLPATTTITTENSPPIAHAGEARTVHVGDTVTLDGSQSSDPDNDTLGYFWSLIAKPDGSLTILANPDQVKPTFVPDLPGDYVPQLIVNDGTVNSAPSTVVITAEE